jgi:dTDP-4-dehydrorhamnose 3,5-epimerase-like enzyme
MPYAVTRTCIPDVLNLEPKIFGDTRGFFFESSDQQDFNQAAGLNVKFVQNNQKQFGVPPGFAHGFVVLSETADFLYKTSNYYAPAHEQCIAWNDPAIGISWPQGLTPQLSAKDQADLSLAQAEVFV